MWPGDLLSTSVNILCCRETFRQFLSTFSVAKTPSVNFPCGQEICQSPSTVCTAGLSSVNILFHQVTFCQLVLIFFAAARSSINFCQHSLWPRDHLSTSVNYPRGRETFSQIHRLSVQPGHYLPTAINILCSWETLRQLPSTFHMAGRPFVKFPPNFREGRRPSINFPCDREFLSTYCASGRSFIKFCQVSAQTGELPTTSVNFLCHRETFVNFRQLSLWPRTFHQLVNF